MIPNRTTLVTMLRRCRFAVKVQPWCRDMRESGYVAKVGRWRGRTMCEWGRTPDQAVVHALQAIAREWKP